MSDSLDIPGVVELSSEEGREMFDRVCRDRLGMSGPDFLAAYDAGRLDEMDHGDVEEVASLIPMVREVPSRPLGDPDADEDCRTREGMDDLRRGDVVDEVEFRRMLYPDTGGDTLR